MISLRLHGTEADIAATLTRLRAAFIIVEQSRPYASNDGTLRVYLRILPPQSGGQVPS